MHPPKKIAESKTELQKDIRPPPQYSLISKEPSPPKTTEFGPVSSLLAHSNGSVPSEIPAQPVRLREKFAENLTGPPNAMGPFPQHSLVPEGPDPVEKAEFGSVLSTLAHPHDPVPPEIVTIPVRPKEKFAEIQQSFQNDPEPFPLHPLDLMDLMKLIKVKLDQFWAYPLNLMISYHEHFLTLCHHQPLSSRKI